MSTLADISLRFGSRLPLIHQTEATECGLACLAMVSGFHGYHVDLGTLRQRFPVSLKGTTLANLMTIADGMGFESRAVKVEMEDLGRLKLPCVLHWDFKHFVVLRSVRDKHLTIHDPARGSRRIPIREASASVTGVALELWRKPDFRPRQELRSVKLRQLMGRVTGLYRSLAHVFALALVLELFALASPLFLQWVVDNVILSADVDLLATLAIGFSLMMLLQVATTMMRSWFVMYLNGTLSVQWRTNVFTHLMRLPVTYFQRRHLGDIVSRFNCIDQIQGVVTTSFIEAIIDGLMAVVTLIVMFLYSPTLAWVVLGAIALYGITRWVWFRALFNATSSEIVLAAKQQSLFLESMRGARTIKLFQRESERRNTWLSVLVDQTNARLRLQRYEIVYTTVQRLTAGVKNIAIIWIGASSVIAGEFTVGVLMAFNLYQTRFDGRVSSLIDKALQFRLLGLFGDRLGDIVLTPPESPPVAGDNPPPAEEQLEPSITLSRVFFKYSETEPFVLHGVSFHIAPGESVAISGPTGGGKTTLLNLVLGIYRPMSGDIFIGGKSVSRIGVESLRRMVATVMQDDVLFAGSIAENISFFDTQVDRQWMEECARMAGVHEEISAMPMGYNSLVGDMGTILSGGQKQRVLLARAFYKRPRILILDEATSHLDLECERRVTNAIKKMGITRLIVAHRAETIATADRHLILSGGKVTDQNRSGPNSRSSQVQTSRSALAYLNPEASASRTSEDRQGEPATQ